MTLTRTRRNNLRLLAFTFGMVAVLGLLLTMLQPVQAKGDKDKPQTRVTQLVSGLQGSIGSTVGPDGALYITEGAIGRISRVNPRTGQITTFASGLPKATVEINGTFIGGPIDLVFIDKTAYVLVTLVGPDFGGSVNDIVGIYRVNGPTSFTVIADIGKFSIANPPKRSFPYFVRTGLQFALQIYRGGFLVTDGHLNRVLRVKLNGEVSELIAFDNIVPTGLTVSGNKVYMAEAGPVPHLPQDGKIVSFSPGSPSATVVASGASLMVAVKFGPAHRLYGLSQGKGSGDTAGSPALPNTGALVKVNNNGTFTVVKDHLDRPSSLEFIGNTAYVVSLTGEVWKIEGVSDNPDQGDRED